MSLARPVAFWIAVFASISVAVVLLHEVLLPFVAGMVLAYLLDPLATRLERLGMSRLIATLTIFGVFVVGVAVLVILTAPVVVDELAYFIDNFPLYIKQVQGLASDSNRPWLTKLVGEGLAYAGQSVGELTTMATGWFRDFLRSVWTGGQALISAFSLLVVTPIVACYLYDWKKMMAVIDEWVPPAHPTLGLCVRSTTRSAALRRSGHCADPHVFHAATLSLLGLRPDF
jgi:predicted PurR-regulated permease PerM